MANPQRGEVAITLSGKEYTLTPTYKALIEIEQLSGSRIIDIARRVMSAEHGIQDAIAIITAGLKASEEPATPDAVGQMIFETGLIGLTPQLTEFLTNALTGGENVDEGEAVAEEAETSNTEISLPSPTQP